MNQDAAFLSLINRYKCFQKTHCEHHDTFVDLVEEGQKPKILIIACCDSRVDPAIITDSKPGELFIVRNIANLVPPCDPEFHLAGTSAALEYAVNILQVRHIIIWGHSHCGGIRACLDAPAQSKSMDSFVHLWMNIISHVKKDVLKKHPNLPKDEQAHLLEKASLKVSLKNLKTFPWIKARVQEKQLFLHAWYFNLHNGIIESYNTTKQQFVKLI